MYSYSYIFIILTLFQNLWFIVNNDDDYYIFSQDPSQQQQQQYPGQQQLQQQYQDPRYQDPRYRYQGDFLKHFWTSLNCTRIPDFLSPKNVKILLILLVSLHFHYISAPTPFSLLFTN